MNANIFSCTVPPLLMLETQIIHPELLQSLCINRCVLLAAICCVDVSARAEAPAPACTCLRAPSASVSSVDPGLTRRLH